MKHEVLIAWTSLYIGVGCMALICAALAIAAKAARARVPVLIEGESGVGKDVIARAVHAASPRHKQAMVTVNCGAIPANLVESELFGHERGAFTGAFDRHVGKFVAADMGTIFLDEVSEMPLDAQVKLLRVLQDGEVQPIGARRPVHVDVRVIAATNKRLSEEIEAGRFREDLYYRLNVVQLTVPPLRERMGDIPALCRHLLARIAGQPGLRSLGLTDDALSLLMQHPWPGNVRALRNVVERAIYRWDDWGQPIGHVVFDPFGSPWKPLDPVKPSPKAAEPRQAQPATTPDFETVDDLRSAVDAHERAIVEHALGKHRWNQRQTAKALGLSYDQLRHCIKKHGLTDGD